MRVLIVGSGGREHALAWKLAQSPSLTELHAAPGNPGIANCAECHPIRADDAEGILGLSRSLGVELVVVGPELPLVLGLADALRRFGFLVFGPSAAAARIEGSKAFAKEVMAAAAVPAAGRLPIARPPCVIKADGLAAGKGVFVCRTQAEVDEALRSLSGIGSDLVVEELLDGPEVSLFAICDGRSAISLLSAQDFKRAFDGDEGPNTGGMGAYAPVPGVDAPEAAMLTSTIHEPVLSELGRRGAPFVGLLYAGLMLTPDGPRVLEFNCRFGDPETQALLPLLEADLVTVLAAAAQGDTTGSRSRSRTALRSRSCSRRSATPKTAIEVGRSPASRRRRRAGRWCSTRNRAPGRPPRDERRTDRGRHRARLDGRGRTRCRVSRRGADRLPGHAPALGHRRSRGRERSSGACSGPPLVTRRAGHCGRASVTRGDRGAAD